MKNYLINLLKLLSHILNVVTGGKPAHSFSARVGCRAAEGKKWATTCEKPINYVFEKMGHKQHCYREYIRMLGPIKF